MCYSTIPYIILIVITVSNATKLSKLEANGNDPELLAMRLLQSEKEMANIKKETINYQNMLQQSHTQLATVERKYTKAKRLVRDYQQREVDMVHQEEVYLQLLQEKDTEYNALVKRLKDRVISLEQKLHDTQRRAGLPVELPYDNASLRLTPQLGRRQPPKPLFQKLDSGLSDTEISDLSPDGEGDGDDDDADGKTATVERKLPAKDELDAVVPPHDLLDNSANRSKGDLVARSLMGAKRQVPSNIKSKSKGNSVSNSSSDCGLNDSDDGDEEAEEEEEEEEAVSESTVSTSTATDTAAAATSVGAHRHNGHGAMHADTSMVSAASSPPLYAQVQKDRSSIAGGGGGGGAGIGGVGAEISAPSVSGGVHHFMSHSTIPNIYKKSVGLHDGSAADARSPYDSILDGGDEVEKSEQWMYPSRARRQAATGGGGAVKPVPIPTVGGGGSSSFTDQLNQVLSEREK